MRNVLLAILIILLIPVYLMVYVSIHEIGHTTLARLLGDPYAVYYLIRVEQDSQAIGYTDYDISKLSWAANLVVSAGGIWGTQIVALAALFLLRLRHVSSRLLQRILSIVVFTFAFDVPFQLMQALGYKGLERWPTGVDLMDVILLLQMRMDANPLLLKGLLALVALLYLSAVIWLYGRSRRDRKLSKPSVQAA